jgi:hypothetical protein
MTILFLQQSYKLIIATVQSIEIVIRQIAPALLNGTTYLFPFSIKNVSIHGRLSYLFTLLYSTRKVRDQSNNKENNKNPEKDLGNAGCGTSHTTKAKEGRDQRNYQKYYRPTYHVYLLILNLKQGTELSEWASKFKRLGLNS